MAAPGQVLILTLILIAFLALTAVELLNFLRPRLELSRGLLSRSVLGKAAETGVARARLLLALPADETGADTPVTTLDEAWAGEISYELGDVLVTVVIEDEERRLPIAFLLEEQVSADTGPDQGEPPPATVSEAGVAVFRELLRQLGFPEQWRAEAADSLADWIEAPEFSRRPAGAGRSYYLAAGYEPRGGLPLTLGELELVKGFIPEVTGELFPRLTPFARRVNLNTAYPEVVKALVLTGESLAVDFLVEARPFESLADVNRKIGRDLRGVIRPEFFDALSVHSSFFAIRSTAEDAAGRRQSVYAVLERDEEEIKVVYWFQPPDAGLPGSRDR